MIPQPFTLAGRSGTIVYLDAQWHPVTPEQAVAARVLYDDGGTAFFVVTPDVAVKAEAFDESEHPRHPGGTSEGGRFAESGRAGEPTSTPELAQQAKDGIAAVEKLMPEALKTADFTALEEDENTEWDDIDSGVRDDVYEKWRDEQYSNIDVDTSDLDAETKRELEENNEAVLETTAEYTLKSLYNSFPDTAPTLPMRTEREGLEEAFTPIEFQLRRRLDPETLEYEEGEDGLNLDALRFTDGSELTFDEQNKVRVMWEHEYRTAFDDAMQKQYESDEYNESRNELESEQIDREWNDLTDSDKVQLARDYGHKLIPKLTSGEPETWTTGVETGDHTDEDYARTHVLAIRLTELRTEEIIKERGLDQRDLPTFTVSAQEIQPGHYSSYPQGAKYVAKTVDEYVVGVGQTEEEAKAAGDEWAKGYAQVKVDPKALIANIWHSWKQKSSEGMGLSLQLAAARELGGVHRMTPEEVAEAVSEAGIRGEADMAVLQAYVRAQWEVTQMIMAKAGETKVMVYRGLMLAGDEVNRTQHLLLDTKGNPIQPTNVRHDEFPNPHVSFDFNGEHFVEPRQNAPGPFTPKVLPPEASDVERWLATIPPKESVEAAVQRRLTEYLSKGENFTLHGSALIKLPDITLQRAGAQSTTGTPSVANNWNGVGNTPPRPTRVVLRVEAPPTSVLSLPVYGQNEQNEHETVIVGTKDRWLWDAFRHKAPTFKDQPLSRTAKKRETTRLVVDLQAEDRGKPHWMSSVDWSKVQKFDEAKHPRHPKGSGDKSGEFASAGKMMYAPDPQFLATVKEHIETAFADKYGELHDVQSHLVSDEVLDQIKARATAVGRAMLARAVPTIRVPDFLAAKILEDGRFKSQHETGESMGMLDPTFRGELEANMFGTDPEGDVKNRPIYGSFMEDFAASRNKTIQYGEVIFVLKDTILERTTVSFSDSLAGSDSKTIAPRPYREFDWVGVGDIGDELTEENSVDRLYTYAEAQFHGGVTMDDVKEVMVPQSLYVHWEQDGLVERFQARGITVGVFAPKVHKARV